MRQIIVLDPGFSELGGHHPATIEALNNSEAIQTASLAVDAYISQDCDSSVFRYFDKKAVNLKPFFKTVFYQHFYQSPSFIESRIYIQDLSQEYYQAIKKSTEIYPETPLLFWCHTLAWQHAYALAMAIARFSKGNEYWQDYCALSVGLMYGSHTHLGDQGADKWRKQLNVEMSFRYLSRQAKVCFFASDYELQQDYTSWLGTSVSIQPNLLLGDLNTLTKKERTSTAPFNVAKKRKVLFYVGDAKVNKGFTQLACQLEDLLPQFPNVEFIVQFTLNNSDINLIHAKKQLIALQNVFHNVKLIDKFIEHQDLLALFVQADAIVFNYDEKVYQHQSSGLFWLSAFYGLPTICLTETWINREALRLGVHLLKSQPNQLQKDITQLFSTLTDISTTEASTNSKDKSTVIHVKKDLSINHYRNELYQDLSTWLLKCHQTLLIDPKTIARELTS